MVVEKRVEQLKKIFVFLTFTAVGLILIVNNVSATVDIFPGITAAIPEPVALLLFGSGLIGLANVGRKTVSRKEKGIARLGTQPTTDS